ncbi:type II toxin-antitoxin system HipA family toxin [Brevundimonas sp.]|uniref:type II toxin-antitoxin system HipA family toxin n=1 Tax=Brevundimonas sp. TaxID=1871086 RepID=UPI0028A682A2|nr:type II toxin-antitoxin system HipA family toxin [Brevundimonas sp.]
MARRPTYAPLQVCLNGRRVGRLRREASGAVDFRYDAAWLAWKHAIPASLSLPLREDRYIGAPVIAVFDNLLPDNEKIRGRVAARVGAAGIDVFSLLTAIGRDCVGALQFLPEGEAPPRPGDIRGEPVSDREISAILDNLSANPLGLDDDADFRISLAGVQDKTAFLRHEGQWFRPEGATPTTHIFKPRIGKLPGSEIDLSDSVENEYLCLTFLRALGFDTADVEIAVFGGKRVLIVKRFDRVRARDGRLLRRPQEDFCQALSVPWSSKYEADGGPGVADCLALLGASDAVADDRRAFMKRIIAFWLLGATDGHAKNFSLFLHPGGGARMTPLYDVLSVQPIVDARKITLNRFRMAMAVGDRRHYKVGSIMPRHFIQTGGRSGLDEATVRGLFAELVRDAPTAIEATRAALPRGFPGDLTDSILDGFTSRLALLEAGFDD